MKPRIWFIKNMTHEAAGLCSFFAEKGEVPYEIVDLHRGEKFPKIVSGQSVVLLGGPDSANDSTLKIQGELEAIREGLAAGVPFLGVCLGLQLLVKAAGGTVLRSPIKEVGFRDPEGAWFSTEKTEAGKTDPLLEGIPDPCKIFELHGETVGLTASMACLARGKFCEHQVVKIQERAYGIQGHVELNEKMLRDWLKADGDLKSLDAAVLLRDFCEVRQELGKNSEILFKNFLKISGILR